MAWPKKHTRRIHVDGSEYLWHLNHNSIYGSEKPITVGKIEGKHFLFIDPYQHDFEITPSSIKSAIIWALENGWSAQSGPTRTMCHSTERKEFRWLPNDIKFEYKLKLEPADRGNG